MNPIQPQIQDPIATVEPIPAKTARTSSLARTRNAAAGDNANEIWFITLSDLLLLLVIFFVLLFGLTWQQQNRPAAVPPPAAESIAAPTPPAHETETASASDSRIADLPAREKVPESLESALSRSLGVNPEEQGITLERRGPEVILTFPERIAFDTGQAVLQPTAEPILETVGAFIFNRPDLWVEIHGHTDDRSIRTPRYPSNWELSADRATQVAKSLIRRGVDPAQVSVKGFGEHRPLASNDTELNRLRNRRVEIHFGYSNTGAQTQ